MPTNPELSSSEYESEEIAESSLGQMADQFDKSSAEEARAKRVAEYKKAHPDAVEDIEKARAMAEAGDEYRTLAATARKEADSDRKRAAQYQVSSKFLSKVGNTLDSSARYDMTRDDVHRRYAKEDSQRAREDQDLTTRFAAKASYLAEHANRQEKAAINHDFMAEQDEYDAERNYDFSHRSKPELSRVESQDESSNDLPEYMRPENKDRYDEALEAINPAVVSKISNTLLTLSQLVDQQDYELIMHAINNGIFEGRYKKARLMQGLGDSEIIVNVE